MSPFDWFCIGVIVGSFIITIAAIIIFKIEVKRLKEYLKL